jgi:hypothetical protein
LSHATPDSSIDTAYAKYHWDDYYFKTGMLALEQAFDCYAAKLPASKSKIATPLQ